MSVSEDRYAELMRAILLAEPYRGVCTEPTRLLDHMYIGSQSNAESLRLLRQLRVTHVLNCAGYKGPRPVPNASPYEGLGIDYHEFQAEDTDCYDICRHFPEAFCYLDQAKRRGGIVLVHCALGINRSAAVCLGYMMTHSRIPLLRATKILKDKRRIALANRGFQRQLVRFARTRGLLDELEPEKEGRERDVEVEGSTSSSTSSSSWRDGDLITEILRSAKNELFGGGGGGGGGSTWRNNHRLLSLDSSSSLKYLTPRYQMTSYRRTSDAPLSAVTSSSSSSSRSGGVIYQPTLNGVSTNDDRLYSGRCSRASIASAAASVERHQLARGRRSLSTPRTVNGLRPISPAINDRRIGSESYSRGRALEFRY